jgi:hypothetical protein
MRDMTRLQGLKVFLFGQKGTDAQVATITEGVPESNQWYRLLNSAGAVVSHAFVCSCSTEYRSECGPFSWQQEHHCSCGTNYRLKSFLERMVTRNRELAGYRAAGLSDNPTPVELEVAKKLKRTVNIKTGPITEEELNAAYNALPYRYANPSDPRNSQPRVIDVWDERLGASDGDTKYGGSNPGPDTMESIGFGDPLAARFRGR